MNGRLTNTSNRPIDASGRDCGPSGLDSYLTWDVRNLKGNRLRKRLNPYPELATGSAILRSNHKAGARVLRETQDISSASMITSRPGEYVIQALRPTSDAKDAQEIKSNKVSVTVIP